MIDFWKLSKSTALTLLVTGILGVGVLSFAYHLRHYTEILSGVIGGLTIILGMVTAEWLRSSKEDASENETRLENLIVSIHGNLLHAEFLLDGPFSPENQEQFKTYMRNSNELGHMAVKTRWPQPNAKEIRDKSLELTARMDAMFRDAVENGHLWSAEKRHELSKETMSLGNLILGGGKKVSDRYTEIYLSSRETQPREGMSRHWLRAAEKEQQRDK